MKIGIIQASSQKDKNSLLYNYTVEATKKYGYEVINFGCFEDEIENYSYIEIAIEISLLLASKAVDFIVTGCSSGQGMMLVCNSLPSVICGFAENPQDAFLFGRINNGNAVSYPLGLNFGWSGEINLKCTLEKLFDGPFGEGYPMKDAERKKQDTLLLKEINALTKREMVDVFAQLDQDLLKKALRRGNVIDYILKYGRNEELAVLIRANKPHQDISK